MPETEAAQADRARPQIRVFAPAKINLTLHIAGRRADGYHLLDSLVAFADVGDRLMVSAQDGLSIHVTGPEAEGVPRDRSNLVLQMAELFEGVRGARFELDKQLPPASGIGGGSADAAAALRALCQWRDAVPPDPDRILALGADVPMCIDSVVARVTGIGQQIAPVSSWLPLPAVLVNPRRAVSTPAVFGAMTRRDHAPMPTDLPDFRGVADAAGWLAAQRNDMQEAAISLEPQITTVTSALAGEQACLLARMSGSGATCFGLFPSATAAQTAARRIAGARPDWWVRATVLGSQRDPVRPRIR